MRGLTGELLLRAWEEGTTLPELRRPLALLAIALPDRDGLELEVLPLAERNRLLLRLHELSFGNSLMAVGSCSECGSQFEFSLSTAELAALTGSADDDEAIEWTEAGRSYQLRAATTADLLASLEVADPGAAQELLVSRCLSVSPEGPAGSGSASATVLEKFEQLHAYAELSCTISCPACSSYEFVDLDIGRFLWAEVRRAAKRLLSDVRAMAVEYGWSEQTILSMSAARRNAYLEMAD